MVKVSILIPVYNCINYIQTCIDSVFNQTLIDIEIICIDDNSTDGTYEYLIERSATDPRLIVKKHENNTGPFQARKDAVQLCSGEYVLLMDSDDELELFACEKLYEIARSSNADLINFQATIRIDGNVTESKYRSFCGFAKSYLGYLSGDEAIKKMFKDHEINCLLWTKFIRASICKKAYSQMPDDFIIWSDDWYACFFILYYTKKYYGIKDKFYIYYLGRGMTTTDGHSSLKLIEKYSTAAKILNPIDEFIRKENAYEYGYVTEYKSTNVDINRLSEVFKLWQKLSTVEEREKGEQILRKYWNKTSYYNLLDEMICKEKVLTSRTNLNWRHIEEIVNQIQCFDISPKTDSYIVSTVTCDNWMYQTVVLLESINQNSKNTNIHYIVYYSKLSDHNKMIIKSCINKCNNTVSFKDIEAILDPFDLNKEELLSYGALAPILDTSVYNQSLFLSHQCIMIKKLEFNSLLEYSKYPIYCIKKNLLDDSIRTHCLSDLKILPINYFETEFIIINHNYDYNELLSRINVVKETYLCSGDNDYFNVLFNDKCGYLNSSYAINLSFFENNANGVGTFSVEYDHLVNNTFVIYYSKHYYPWRHPENMISTIYWKYARNTDIYASVLDTSFKDVKHKKIVPNKIISKKQLLKQCNSYHLKCYYVKEYLISLIFGGEK